MEDDNTSRVRIIDSTLNKHDSEDSIDSRVDIYSYDNDRSGNPEDKIYQINHDNLYYKNEHLSQGRFKDDSTEPIKIFFKNIPREMNTKDVSSFFSKYGKLKYIRVPYSMKKKRNMGYGNLVFEDRSLAKMLLSQEKYLKIENKLIELSELEPRKKKKKTISEGDLESRRKISNPIYFPSGKREKNREPRNLNRFGTSKRSLQGIIPIDERSDSYSKTENILNIRFHRKEQSTKPTHRKYFELRGQKIDYLFDIKNLTFNINATKNEQASNLQP